MLRDEPDQVMGNRTTDFNPDWIGMSMLLISEPVAKLSSASEDGGTDRTVAFDSNGQVHWVSLPAAGIWGILHCCTFLLITRASVGNSRAPYLLKYSAL